MFWYIWHLVPKDTKQELKTVPVAPFKFDLNANHPIANKAVEPTFTNPTANTQANKFTFNSTGPVVGFDLFSSQPKTQQTLNKNF